MSDVVKLHPAREPDEVLEEAKGDFQALFVCGWDNNGELDMRATQDMDRATAVLLLTTAVSCLIEDMKT